MKIKICGMKFRDNLQEIQKLQPDYLGFIFYQKSPRLMTTTLSGDDLRNISSNKTGVFVNQPITEIEAFSRTYNLNCIQLHGQETPEFCAQLKDTGLDIIKVFSVDEGFDFSITKKYENCSDYFLFDTKGKYKGGNGFAFNWQLLLHYNQKLPFFLSGGIGPENFQQILELKNLNLFGIDMNSRVETSPGLKDLQKVQQVMLNIKKQTTDL